MGTPDPITDEPQPGERRTSRSAERGDGHQPGKAEPGGGRDGICDRLDPLLGHSPSMRVTVETELDEDIEQAIGLAPRRGRAGRPGLPGQGCAEPRTGGQ